MRLKTGLILRIFILSIFTLPVWWVIWFMITGTFLSVEELGATIGPALNNTDGMSIWTIIPTWPTLQPIVELLLDTPQFFIMFWNTFTLVVPSVLGQLIFGAPAAWALSRFRFKMRKSLLTIYITLMLMPFQVTMVPNYLVLNSIGLMDTLWAVIIPFSFSAFPVFIMVHGFNSVRREMLEAAAIDGAGHFRTFVKIGLPLGMPGILAAMVLGFIESWSAIEQPMTFIKNPALWPLSLYLPQIVTQQMGLAMTASLLMLLPPVLIFLFGQKYLELGIQSTGIKE
jgi:multiple sugar transport system permease protein